ncbi:hypothetical protein TIFTF001_028505 [Ficus carica]|uniref:Uncharacterized protein n=1 Tax=Ficus carica TaxID=3494 RepID=A0AA88DPW7_FICCA|nr:hypothetical protein TIFTF001_028505 [Ficus carica]
MIPSSSFDRISSRNENPSASSGPIMPPRSKSDPSAPPGPIISATYGPILPPPSDGSPFASPGKNLEFVELMPGNIYSSYWIVFFLNIKASDGNNMYQTKVYMTPEVVPKKILFRTDPPFYRDSAMSLS